MVKDGPVVTQKNKSLSLNQSLGLVCPWNNVKTKSINLIFKIQIL